MNYDEMSVEELILHFRNTYEEVYLTTLGNEDFIWRTLTRKEYFEITEFADNDYDAYERICNKAVLYPVVNFATSGRAYLPEQLAPQILDESGYGRYRKEQGLLTVFRDQMNQFENQAEVIINRAFPYITFDEMENWTKEKLLKYVAKAEWSLHFIDQKNHIQLMTEEEIKEQEAEENEDNQEEEETFDLMKLAGELRQRGQDPMFVLRHLYQKEKPEYFDRPLIGGKNQRDTLLAGAYAWKEGALQNGRYEIIREQVQRISRR